MSGPAMPENTNLTPQSSALTEHYSVVGIPRLRGTINYAADCGSTTSLPPIAMTRDDRVVILGRCNSNLIPNLDAIEPITQPAPYRLHLINDRCYWTPGILLQGPPGALS